MQNKITAICISTVHARNLPVMLKSIEQYVPSNVEIYIAHSEIDSIDYHSRWHSMHLVKSTAGNFGDAYNFICQRAFEKHETIVVANDDIVFDPTTFSLLQSDWQALMNYDSDNVGYLACRTNYSRGKQNIRWRNSESKFVGIKFSQESTIIETDIIAPICAVIRRQSWIDFLSINQYSDDVQCLMMADKGLKHFVSRSYVHHVGSQTVNLSANEFNNTLDYLRKNHLKYYHYITA
jgi:hypothetical protein